MFLSSCLQRCQSARARHRICRSSSHSRSSITCFQGLLVIYIASDLLVQATLSSNTPRYEPAVVKITDAITPNVFSELLRFIYSGNCSLTGDSKAKHCNDKQEAKELNAESKDELAVQLLFAANTFQ